MQTSVCVICMDQFGTAKVCTLENCGHAFHSVCLQTWLLTRDRDAAACPVCRNHSSLCQHSSSDQHLSIALLLDIIKQQHTEISALKKELATAQDARMSAELLLLDNSITSEVLINLHASILNSTVQHLQIALASDDESDV